MGFIIEVFWAVLMVGAPVSVFTLAIVWWGLQNGHFQDSLSTKGLEREIKAMSEANKKKTRKQNKENGVEDAKLHPVQKKWAKFGSGFYGIVAFFTYIVVEVLDLINMVREFGGFVDFLKQFDFDVIIGIFVEALTNFVTAMVWPIYWMRRIDTDQTWVWFVVAYGGYWLGLKVAQLLVQRQSGAEA